MEIDELKRKLMGLWEKTSHISKEMINNLFDYYFDERYLEYKETEGKIISAVFGIPYQFKYGGNSLKGLYIIPLSTEEGYKKKNKLTDLLYNINFNSREEFDFTFIVPHTNLLADYYGSQGYLSSFFVLEERYTPLHDFRNDYYLSLQDSEERIRELKKNLFDEITAKDISNEKESWKDSICNFIRNNESKGQGALNLCHSQKDILYLLSDDTIRGLNIFIALDSDNKITGLAFTQKEDFTKTKVVAVYVSDLCSYYVLLDTIKRQFSEHSLSVVTSDNKYQSHSIIQKLYASENPKGGDLDNTFSMVEIPFNLNKLLQPMGMVKLIRFDRIMEFIAATRSDVEFKIHIRDFQFPDGDNNPELKKRVYSIKNGKLCYEDVDRITDRHVLVLSEKEFSELLLRKNDSSNLIMDAFGIPRLNLRMRLLAC